MATNQFEDIQLFEGKNLSGLFQEIYDNQVSKKQQIRELINSLTPLVEGIGDATLLVPLIKEYMELGIKNDELLVKLAQIVQRVETGKKGAQGDMFDFSSLEGLLQEDAALEDNLKAAEANAEQVVENVNSNYIRA